MRKILIVEDEPDIAMVLQAYLTKAGYGVKIASEGRQAMDIFERWRPTIILLDVMLPDMDGWSILRAIREQSSCPVIMLSALHDIDSRLAGLNGGADDYICKPFVGEEVVARVKTVLRRSPQYVSEHVAIYGSLKIDNSTCEVSLHGQPVHLAPRDMELLFFLASHPNQLFDREQLIASVWGLDYEGSDRVVDLSINRIRQALADWPHDEGEIVTLRRLGYKLRVHS